MKDVKAFLFDSAGRDEEIELEGLHLDDLTDQQVLWVIVTKRDRGLLGDVTGALGLRSVPCDIIVNGTRPPDLDKFDQFFRFSVDSIITEQGHPPERMKVDYVVGPNFVITVSEGEPGYFEEFRKREEGESPMSGFDAKGLVSSLLDQNVVTYFVAINEVERRVDLLDDAVIKREYETEAFLREMMQLRGNVSKLRRLLTPHREVYYALSRADLRQIADSEAREQFQLAIQHYESAVEAIAHARETVLSVFDLYATKSTHLTNLLIQRLTFLTLLTGSLAVVAGILGMNFKSEIFEMEYGFLGTVAGLLLVGVGITAYARHKRWI